MLSFEQKIQEFIHECMNRRCRPMPVDIDESLMSENYYYKKMGFKTYDDYIESQLWQLIRKRIVKRDGGCCARCGGSAGVLDVHHRAYHKEVMEGNADAYLITLCEGCHYVVHCLDRDDGHFVERPFREWEHVLLSEDVSVDYPLPIPYPYVANFPLPWYAETFYLSRKIDESKAPRDWLRLTSVQKICWIRTGEHMGRKRNKRPETVSKEKWAKIPISSRTDWLLKHFPHDPFIDDYKWPFNIIRQIQNKKA